MMWMNLLNRKRQTERMNLHLLEGRMERRDRQGVWDGHLHTAIFKMDNQQREWMYSCWREEWREGIEREFGMGMYFLLFLKWIANKDLLCSTWNFAHCYVAAWRERSLGGEWMHVCVCVCVCVCMAESLCCSPGIVTTLFVNQLCHRTKINFKNK